MSGKLKHGHAVDGEETITYVSWQSMHQRCREQKKKPYIGITVCNRWSGVNGFTNFLADMDERPSNKHSIDRFPNQHGDYEPNNCRWATGSEQQNNRQPIAKPYSKRTDNSSGFRGVCWHKRDAVYHVTITVNRQRIHIGTFRDFSKAADARIESEKQHGLHGGN